MVSQWLSRSGAAALGLEFLTEDTKRSNSCEIWRKLCEVSFVIVRGRPTCPAEFDRPIGLGPCRRRLETPGQSSAVKKKFQRLRDEVVFEPRRWRNEVEHEASESEERRFVRFYLAKMNSVP